MDTTEDATIPVASVSTTIAVHPCAGTTVRSSNKTGAMATEGRPRLSKTYIKSEYDNDSIYISRSREGSLNIKSEPRTKINLFAKFSPSEFIDLLDPASLPEDEEEAEWYRQNVKANDEGDFDAVVDWEDEITLVKDTSVPEHSPDLHIKVEAGEGTTSGAFFDKRYDVEWSDNVNNEISPIKQEIKYEYNSDYSVLPITMENGREYIDFSLPYFAPVIKIEDDGFIYPQPTNYTWHLPLRPGVNMAEDGPFGFAPVGYPFGHHEVTDHNVSSELDHEQIVYGIDPNL